MDKKIHDMNDRIRQEVGTNPEYKWLHASDGRMSMAFQVMDSDGKPVLDWVCPCGVNVNVHRASCEGFSLPKTRFVVKPIGKPGTWSLCVRVQPDKTAWHETMGALPYPSHGHWSPVTSDDKTLTLDQGKEPDWELTWEFIKMIRESRELGFDYVEKRNEKIQKDSDDRDHQHRMAEFDTVTGVRQIPGKVDGNVSLPTVVTKRKNTVSL